ncbi:hypothetical protein [Variovorax atrisoli]|uniref:hypothetical protein n=1 Tax=Variovorax atrisoli TaxID=3394203 RepID=UPI0013DF86C2|nr:hypothetical protein [Variovorax sp. 369]
MSKSNKSSPEVRYQSLIDFQPIELVSQSPSVIACLPSRCGHFARGPRRRQEAP